MEKAPVITKKYNHMNFDSMDNASFGFNSFNFMLGMITMEHFQLICGAVGLVMQLIQFLTKQYWLIKNNKNPDADPAHTDIDAAPFERRCFGCAKQFEPAHADQIFCEAVCKDTYMADLSTRKPFIKQQPDNG